jgi:hypothetical protein
MLVHLYLLSDKAKEFNFFKTYKTKVEKQNEMKNQDHKI